MVIGTREARHRIRTKLAVCVCLSDDRTKAALPMRYLRNVNLPRGEGNLLKGSVSLAN